jgi:nicotinamidase-related amidase
MIVRIYADAEGESHFEDLGFAFERTDLVPPAPPVLMTALEDASQYGFELVHPGVSRTLVRGTWGTEILPELAPKDGDIVVAKHRYSGFFETELDAILREDGIDSLIFTGCTTSVCVDSTLRDAFYRDYRCLLLSDCTGEPLGSELARSNHEASLLVIETLFGWVSDSSALLRALQQGDAAMAGTARQLESS